MARHIRVGFISLGCAKNLVDSEVMLGLLAQAGCAITSDLADADAIVVNTCGFLGAARQEALDAIAEAVRYKRAGRCRRVVVVGCLVQRDGEALRQTAEGIDALLGVNEREKIAEVVRGSRGESAVSNLAAAPCPTLPPDMSRLRLTPRAYAYLRIGEGCDQKCTFCTIPRIRGPMRSKRPNVVLKEARELIADGVVELNVIAQDTTAYGRDIGLPSGPAAILRRLDRLSGIAWIRLMYAYPRFFDDALIDAIAECRHVVKYVDMPLQHINDRVLRWMGRRVKRCDIERLLRRLRDRVPGIAIRTTMMVGFPGETEAEFRELLAFVRDFRFDALGAFAYSREPEAPAARLPNQTRSNVKQRRLDRLMQAQQAIAFGRADAMIGRQLDLLVERMAPDGRLIARHAGQAPEVDSVVHVTDPPARPDRFLTAECVARDGYDLIAKPAQGILRSQS